MTSFSTNAPSDPVRDPHDGDQQNSGEGDQVDRTEPQEEQMSDPTPAVRRLILERLRSGYYDQDEAMQDLARRLLERPDPFSDPEAAE